MNLLPRIANFDYLSSGVQGIIDYQEKQLAIGQNGFIKTFSGPYPPEISFLLA
jgi:hypothetical protein